MLLVFVAVTVCFNQSWYRLLLLYLYLCSSLDLYSYKQVVSEVSANQFSGNWTREMLPCD